MSICPKTELNDQPANLGVTYGQIIPKIKIFTLKRPHEKGKYRSTDNTKIRKREETSTEKMKRSVDERHTETHGSLTDTF